MRVVPHALEAEVILVEVHEAVEVAPSLVHGNREGHERSGMRLDGREHGHIPWPREVQPLEYPCMEYVSLVSQLKAFRARYVDIIGFTVHLYHLVRTG